MAEAAQDSATPKPAIAQTTINCACEGLVKPDPLQRLRCDSLGRFASASVVVDCVRRD